MKRISLFGFDKQLEVYFDEVTLPEASTCP